MDLIHKKCLLCNGTNLKDLKIYQKDGLVKCGSCSFVFSKKIPTSQELLAHYDQYRRNTKVSRITIKRYNELLDRFEEYRSTNNIMDIGCGDGYFLEVAAQRGWKVYGTEFTDEAVNVCKAKGINTNMGVLNPENYRGLSFDIITSFEVIEHINDPQPELAKITKLLRTNGLLYITTPNFNSISRYVLGPKWTVIQYPEHLSYYTSKTLNTFLLHNGFKKVKLEATGIDINRYKATAGPSTEIFSGENLRQKTESKTFYKYLKIIANWFLNLTLKGDNLKGSYIKTVK